MDPAFLMGLLIWVSGAGFGWLWRHYSWNHHKQSWNEGYVAGRRYEIHRRGVRLDD